MEENIKLKAKIYDLMEEKESILEKHKTMNDALLMIMTILNNGEVKDDVSIQDVIGEVERHKDVMNKTFKVLDLNSNECDIEELPLLVDDIIPKFNPDCEDDEIEDEYQESDYVQLNDSPTKQTITVYEDEEMSVDRAMKGNE